MDYSLLDSGDQRKLERLGEFVLSRPESQALWKKALSDEEWQKADATFEKGVGWQTQKGLPDGGWTVEIGGIKFKINLKSFKHTGVFPEQIENWHFIENLLKIKNSKLKILNLFGYTGGATIAAARSGREQNAEVEVVHVDASKPSVSAAKENAILNGLEKANIRYIVDDAHAFVKREIKRQEKGVAKYDALILDPPSFGRGAKGEVWKIEEDLVPLLEACKSILSDNPAFVLLNGYASGYSHTTYAELLQSVFQFTSGSIESGELSLKESSPRAFSLPAGIFARWKA